MQDCELQELPIVREMSRILDEITNEPKKDTPAYASSGFILLDCSDISLVNTMALRKTYGVNSINISGSCITLTY